MAGAGTALVGGVAAVSVRDHLAKESAVVESEPVSEPQPTEVETIEELKLAAEDFNNEVAGYQAFTELRKDEVLYVDEHNKPVGQPQAFADFIDSKAGFVGDYLYSPGQLAESGVLADVPTKEWRDYVKGKVQAEFPESPIANDMNVVRIFQAAYASGDSFLQEKIASGEIASRDQLLDYYINIPLPEAATMNRVEYLQEQVVFRDELEEVAGVPGAEKVPVPPVVQAELRQLLPGLFAQESGFKEDLVNTRTQAKGPGQFMPETWQRYTGETEVSTSLAEQVAVLGPAISDMYDRVLDKIGDDILTKLQSLFPNEETFLLDVITPLTISGYNTGPDRAAAAARLYVESIQLNDMPVGKDLFMAIANFAEASEEGLLSGYKQESREYVTRVYAAANVLKSKYPAPSSIQTGSA